MVLSMPFSTSTTPGTLEMASPTRGASWLRRSWLVEKSLI
jgi:hypothetical protein